MSNNLIKYLIATLSLTLVVVFSGMVPAADPPKTPAKSYNKPFQLKDGNKLLVPLTDKQKRQMKEKMGPDGRPLPQIQLDRCPDSVIQEFSISEPSCSIEHDPGRALLSYRVSPPEGYKIASVKIDHVSLVDGRRRTVYNRSASTMDPAWSARASESGIRDPGPVNASNSWGEYRLLATSTCLGIPRIPATTSRNIRYGYRLPVRFVIPPVASVHETRVGSVWRYTVSVSEDLNVARVMFKYPPLKNDYGCRRSSAGCNWTGGSRTFVFDSHEKLSDRGVMAIHYRASSIAGGCRNNVDRSVELIPYTAPSPSPEPSPESADGSWWYIQCNCADVSGVTLVVPVRACMVNTNGARVICGYLAGDLSRSSGIKTSCDLRLVREHTDEGSCRPGDFSIIP